MNLTVLSLSISSIYSLSPFFIGNRNQMHQFSLKNYLSSTVFLNPEQLKLERSFFTRGIGSIIYANRLITTSEDLVLDFIEDDFNNDNIFDFEAKDSKALVMVRDCTFSNIQYKSLDNGNDNTIDNHLIKISREFTFYMTSCTFDSCDFEKSILFLSSKATTVSHICCSKLTGSGDTALFLKTNTPGNSFFKFIYSTIIGTDQQLSNQNVNFLQGLCALRYQCINTSHFQLKFDGDRSITRIESSSCLTMLMNTFSNLDSQFVLWINVHDGASDGRYNHYCGLSNFDDINQHSAFIYFDMQTSTRITVDQCCFRSKNPEEEIRIINTNNDAKIYIKNCVFNSNLGTSQLSGLVDEYNVMNPNDFQTHTLAHYTVVGKCDATYLIDAFGCQNDTCPDGNGCETFGFNDGDVVYTEIFHPDINTPMPTKTEEFSKSSLFSESLEFSYSDVFSNSHDFSQSRKFSETGDFSRSNYFTKTCKFSESNDFSQSNGFSESNNFLPTGKFSESNGFSFSGFFSNSNEFSRSGFFTESTDFTKSSEFSPTYKFSESNGFSFSGFFSNSNEFSRSCFFTESTDFTKSSNFDPTYEFNRTISFTPSSKFTGTSDFSRSEDFSSSVHFTESRYFSDSGEFSKSNDFTNSETIEIIIKSSSRPFTPSGSFTSSNHFTSSNEFSSSYNFTESDFPFVDRGIGNIGSGGKIGTGPIIGIVLGAIAAAAIIIALIAFFIIKKKKSLDVESADADVMNGQESVISVENTLQDIMDNDDPFGNEFK